MLVFQARNVIVVTQSPRTLKDAGTRAHSRSMASCAASQQQFENTRRVDQFVVCAKEERHGRRNASQTRNIRTQSFVRSSAGILSKSAE